MQQSDLASRRPGLEATNEGDRKGLLYEATLFVNTWEGAVSELTHASVHTPCLPSPESSPLLCSPLQSSLKTVGNATVVRPLVWKAVFWLKIPGHGHVQKKLHYMCLLLYKNLYFNISVSKL